MWRRSLLRLSNSVPCRRGKPHLHTVLHIYLLMSSFASNRFTKFCKNDLFGSGALVQRDSHFLGCIRIVSLRRIHAAQAHVDNPVIWVFLGVLFIYGKCFFILPVNL